MDHKLVWTQQIKDQQMIKAFPWAKCGKLEGFLRKIRENPYEV
jgi:uncharacterized protein (DUF169 family)